MRSNGVIRRVDELGRVVIPIDMRTQLNIVEKDPLEIYVEEDAIILRKYEQKCIFCNSTKRLSTFDGKLICKKCMANIAKLNNHLQP